MWQSYIISLYRNAVRHKLFAMLNIGGLGLALGVAIMLFVVVSFERGYDRWLPVAGEVARLTTTQSPPGAGVRAEALSPGVALDLLRQDVPEIRAATRILTEEIGVVQQGRTSRETLKLVDPDFFSVLPLPFWEGGATGLSGTSDLILSQSMAARYFPDGSAIGKPLNLIIRGMPHTYTVRGVIRDIPPDSSLRIDMIAILSPALLDASARTQVFDDWDSLTVQTFLLFDDKHDLSRANAAMDGFISRRSTGASATATRFTLAPLHELHLFDGQHAVRGDTPGVDPLILTGLSVVALMILAIAAINYVNLATARAVMRSREVALRKVLGADRRALVTQFLSEALLSAAVAGVIGLALAELFLPVLNAFQGTELRIAYLDPRSGVLLPLVLSVIVVGLVAGFYPALVLSRFPPAQILGASRTGGGGRAGARIRQMLVLLQFSAAVALGICAVIMMAQADFIRRADVGFNRSNLILVTSFADNSVAGQRPALVNAFQSTPGVTSVTVSSRAPATDTVTSTLASRPGSTAPESQLVIELVGPDYFSTYGLKLAAGRELGPRMQMDDMARVDTVDGRNVMLNEAAVETLGFSSPSAAVGQPVRFGGGVVVVAGVVRDARFRAPEEAVSPILYLYSSGRIPNAVAAVRYTGATRSVMAELESRWRMLAPEAPFAAATATDSMSIFYRAHEQRSRLFAVGAVIALIVGLVGLYGLTVFTAERRAREISIRKVLGASTSDVLHLLLRQSLSPVVLAVAIASPLAFLTMRYWLAQFDMRTQIAPWHFLIVGGVASLVAALSILGEAWKAARTSPSATLRSE